MEKEEDKKFYIFLALPPAIIVIIFLDAYC